MSSCAKCGACSAVCPVYRVSGREVHSARGKLHLLDTLGLHGKHSPSFVDIFSACLLCGACSAVCPRQLDIEKELLTAREKFSSLAGPHAYEKYLARKVLDSPGALRGLRLLGRGCEALLGAALPQDSGLRLRLALFQDETVSPRAPEERGIPASLAPRLLWFPGCAARYLFPDILSSCQSLLAGISFSLYSPDDLVCCGLAHWAAGDGARARKSARQNIKVLRQSEGPVVVSCASCYAHLKDYPTLFQGDPAWHGPALEMASRLVELSAFLEEQDPGSLRPEPEGSSQKIRVFYHDPCHLRHGDVPVDKARQLLARHDGVELVELPFGTRCCGQGGLFQVAHPGLSATIRDALVTDVLALRPDVVTSTCSGCLMQWRQGLQAVRSGVVVLHLAQLLGDKQP